MAKCGTAHWIFGMVLGTLFSPSTSIAFQGVSPDTSHPGWNDVVRLLSSPQRPIDAETIERLLGVKMSRRTRAADDYDAWVPGQKADSIPSVRLTFIPSHYKGYSGRHESTIQIFVRDIECISPARMRDDLLRAGLTSVTAPTPATTLEFYMFGEHRSLRVTYPPRQTGVATQLWAIKHHSTEEDRRCVGDIVVTEGG